MGARCDALAMDGRGRTFCPTQAGALTGSGCRQVEEGIDREALLPRRLDQEIPDTLTIPIDELLTALPHGQFELLQLADGQAFKS